MATLLYNLIFRTLPVPIDVDLVPVFEFLPNEALGKIRNVLARNNGVKIGRLYFYLPFCVKSVNCVKPVDSNLFSVGN